MIKLNDLGWRTDIHTPISLRKWLGYLIWVASGTDKDFDFLGKGIIRF
jgi:hypothetical protein